MANFIRSAKSGSDWTKNELLAYNIRIVPKSDMGFFGEVPEKLPENLSKEFLEYEFGRNDSLEDDSDNLLEYLDLASRSLRGQESMVDDFARELLKSLGFEASGRLLRIRHAIPLIICGSTSLAQTDVSILRKRSGLILLVQEDKRQINIKDPEPQVIAEAIAAFQENNRIREESGLEGIDRMAFPCITMIGTFPRFYLVPVTKELSYCVIGGVYPNDTTEVLKYTPRVPNKTSDAMKNREDRKKILQCYESFKKFVDELEEQLRRE
jgi:hypothetical protein